MPQTLERIRDEIDDPEVGNTQSAWAETGEGDM